MPLRDFDFSGDGWVSVAAVTLSFLGGDSEKFWMVSSSLMVLMLKAP